MTKRLVIDDELFKYLENEKEFEEMISLKTGNNENISFSNIIRKRLFLPMIERGKRIDLKKKGKFEDIILHIITIFQRYGGQRIHIPKFRIFDNRFSKSKLNEALNFLKKDYYFVYIKKLKIFEVWRTEFFEKNGEEVINRILEKYKDEKGNRLLKKRNLVIQKHGFIGELPKGNIIKRNNNGTVIKSPIEFIYKIDTKNGDSCQFYSDYFTNENSIDLVGTSKEIDKFYEYFWYEDPIECYSKIINLLDQ